MPALYAYAAAVEAGSLPSDLDIEFLEIGIGKAAAAAAISRRLATGTRPDVVVLFGVAGSYHEDLQVGQVCVVAEDCLADEGAATESGFRSLVDLGLPGKTGFAMDARRTAIAGDRLGVPAVRAATVSTCSAEDALAATLAKRTGAAVESMEGAAVALACEAWEVPLVQIRCVSNRTGDRSRGGWDLAAAAAGIQQAVRTLIDSDFCP